MLVYIHILCLFTVNKCVQEQNNIQHKIYIFIFSSAYKDVTLKYIFPMLNFIIIEFSLKTYLYYL